MTAGNKKEESNVRQGNENLIRITKVMRSWHLISEKIRFNARIKIVGGGCNGLSYKMKFTDTKLGDILVKTKSSYWRP